MSNEPTSNLPPRADPLEVLAARADACANRRDEALARRDGPMAAFWRGEYAAARDASDAVRALLLAVQQVQATPAPNPDCGLQGCGRATPADCRCLRSEQALQALAAAMDRIAFPPMGTRGEG